MPWPYRHIVIVSAEEQAAANVVAASIDPDDGSDTFGVRLSASGNEPATHFGCHTLANEAMAGVMYDSQSLLTSVRWWRTSADTQLLIDSNTPHGSIGQRFTWQDALTSLSLQPIAPEETP